MNVSTKINTSCQGWAMRVTACLGPRTRGNALASEVALGRWGKRPAMAENKTRENKASVSGFLNSIEDARKRSDAKKVGAMMRKATGKQARMWGSAIVGYGKYHYKYESGREGDYMLTGYSPRKQNLVVYIMPGFSDFSALMKKLGKYKTGKSCLYLKKLEDVDENILEKLIDRSVKLMRKRYDTK